MENAAQDEVVTLETPAQEEIEQTTDTQTTESAPVDTDQTKKDPQEVFQKRINKEVGRTYNEKRRADDLQKQVDELRNKPVEAPATSTPKLEDFDFDQDAHNAAMVKHQVAEAMQAHTATAKKDSDNQKAQEAQATFNERVATLGKEDFAEVADAVPNLPLGVADALVQSENGAELIYHLGKHLDLADQLAGMTPAMAMMELGKISLNMSAQPEIKLSAAPDPIEPINSGGSLNKDVGEMSMEEIYNG